MSDAHRTMLRSHGIVVARVLLGLLFVLGGWDMLQKGAPVDMIAGMGIPLAGLVAWLVVAVKLLGGLALMLGYRVGCAAGALFIFTLLTIVLVHNNAEEMGAALKNLSIMGGLLYAMAYGAGDGWKLGK